MSSYGIYSSFRVTRVSIGLFKKVCLGFSVRYYSEIQTNFLANSTLWPALKKKKIILPFISINMAIAINLGFKFTIKLKIIIHKISLKIRVYLYSQLSCVKVVILCLMALGIGSLKKVCFLVKFSISYRF